MKILFITNNVLPNSGWGRYSLGVLNEMRRRRIDFTVASETSSSAENQYELLSKSKLAFLSNILKVRRLAKGCDIVHALDGWPYGVYGYFAVLGTNKKLFINAVGTYAVAPLYGGLKKMLLGRAYKKANSIFAISRYVKNRICELLALNNVSVVHLAADPLSSIGASDSESFKLKNGLKDKYPIILTVGEIKERKGQIDTLKAIKLLKQKYPKIFYVMIGSAKDKSYVERIDSYAKENDLHDNYRVEPGVKDDSTLSLFYNACDVFVLNSNNDGRHFEGFGLVILEANQFGKPAIGSKNCGIEDAIGEGRNGYLSKPKDAEDIKSKIGYVLGEGKIPAENIKAWHDSFSWQKTVDKYIEEYGKN